MKGDYFVHCVLSSQYFHAQVFYEKKLTAISVRQVKEKHTDLIYTILDLFHIRLYCRVWILGYIYCKVNNYVSYLTVSLSVFTLLAISIDRRKVRPENFKKYLLNLNPSKSGDSKPAGTKIWAVPSTSDYPVHMAYEWCSCISRRCLFSRS